jgi:hypothetical protein
MDGGFRFWDEEKVLEMGGSDGCTAHGMNVLNSTKVD